MFCINKIFFLELLRAGVLCVNSRLCTVVISGRRGHQHDDDDFYRQENQTEPIMFVIHVCCSQDDSQLEENIFDN